MGWGLHVRWERLRWPNQEIGRELVGAGRFELPTPCSRSKCATRLRHAARLTPSSIAMASHPLLSPPALGVNANSAAATTRAKPP